MRSRKGKATVTDITFENSRHKNYLKILWLFCICVQWSIDSNFVLSYMVVGLNKKVIMIIHVNEMTCSLYTNILLIRRNLNYLGCVYPRLDIACILARGFCFHLRQYCPLPRPPSSVLPFTMTNSRTDYLGDVENCIWIMHISKQ